MELFLSIFFTTFLLEDVAMGLSVTMVGSEKMSFLSAFIACFLGISIGDIGLYILGRWASGLSLKPVEEDLISRPGVFKNFKVGFNSWLLKMNKYKPDQKTESYISYSVVLSRFVPGTRIPAYVGAGLLKYSFTKFFILTVFSVAFWVLFILLGGNSLYHFFKGNLIYALIGVFVLLILSKALIPKLLNYWQRRSLVHFWRKWVHFEFWPAWIFYSPIVFVYIYRSLVGRSFLLPFYSNPQILNSGLMGESKWDFLKFLNPNESTTIATVYLDKTLSRSEINRIIEQKQFKIPFILKPDVGQRGYGVRIIRSNEELDEYLTLAEGLDLVLQELSQYQPEAGIFYYRKPSDDKGNLFSITDKKFPYVVGNGKARLGDLILKDKRARIIAPVYFERFENLDLIVPNGKKIVLSECGNHCQGAVFINGEHLKSKSLLNEIDKIAKQIPDFYFGRFDVRYSDPESLMNGLNFEIIEINGAGSEATHIWDSKTKLLEAYKVLWLQWKILFEIGLEVKNEIKAKKRSKKNINVLGFLKEVILVVCRKDKISTSS